MSYWIIRQRTALRMEAGMTLVELLVAMFVFSIVMTVVFGVLASVQRSVALEDRIDLNNDQARLAIEQLDREIRSGNVLYDPASESPAYQTLRIYTQTNATTRTPSPGYFCVLWQITSAGDLRTRNWPPNEPESATSWRTVANYIVNRQVSPQVHAFSIDSDPLKGSRTLDVMLLVNQDVTDHSSQTVRIQASLTGRNTSYGFPQDVCEDLPT